MSHVPGAAVAAGPARTPPVVLRASPTLRQFHVNVHVVTAAARPSQGHLTVLLSCSHSLIGCVPCSILVGIPLARILVLVGRGLKNPVGSAQGTRLPFVETLHGVLEESMDAHRSKCLHERLIEGVVDERRAHPPIN